MGIQAWMIKSWPICQWYLPEDQVELPTFWHLNTHVRDDLDSEGRRIGETVWMAEINGQDVAAAWEWTELRAGVVLLSDPNSVASNVSFLTPQMGPADPLYEAIALNRIAHSLSWQETVCDVIRTVTAPGETASPPRALRPRAAVPRWDQQGACAAAAAA